MSLVSTARRAKIAIFVIVVVGFVLGSFPLWTVRVQLTKKAQKVGYNYTRCTISNDHKTEYKMWSIVVLSVGTLAVPGAIILVATAAIIHFLVKAGNRRQQHMEGQSAMRKSPLVQTPTTTMANGGFGAGTGTGSNGSLCGIGGGYIKNSVVGSNRHITGSSSTIDAEVHASRKSPVVQRSTRLNANGCCGAAGSGSNGSLCAGDSGYVKNFVAGSNRHIAGSSSSMAATASAAAHLATDASTRRYQVAARRRGMPPERQLSVMLVSVCLAFICLRLPYTIVYPLHEERHPLWGNDIDALTELRLFIAKQTFDIVATFNYVANFFLYCLSGSYFRSQIRAVFAACGRRGGRRQGIGGSSRQGQSLHLTRINDEPTAQSVKSRSSIITRMSVV